VYQEWTLILGRTSTRKRKSAGGLRRLRSGQQIQIATRESRGSTMKSPRARGSVSTTFFPWHPVDRLRQQNHRFNWFSRGARKFFLFFRSRRRCLRRKLWAMGRSVGYDLLRRNAAGRLLEALKRKTEWTTSPVRGPLRLHVSYPFPKKLV